MSTFLILCTEVHVASMQTTFFSEFPARRKRFSGVSNPKLGRNVSLRKVGAYAPNYIAPHFRRQQLLNP